MTGGELASLLPDWLYFIRGSVHASTSGSCIHAAQHSAVCRPFMYYEIVRHGVNPNNIILTNWIVHGTPTLGWPNLLTPRAQRFSYLYSLPHAMTSPAPCSGPAVLPFSLALPPPQVHTLQIFSMSQEVQCTCFQDPRGAVAESLQPPTFLRNLSPSLGPPHPHRTWLLCSFTCMNVCR